MHARQKTSGGTSRPAVIGFLIPLVLAILIALLLHHPAAKPGTASTSPTVSKAASGPLPSADEVSAANAAILTYCRSDLRTDESCSLVPDSNKIAPGFVEASVNESGQFDPGGANGRGEALAKGSGNSWQVIWVGQGCVPQDVATQNKVPASLDVCS